MAKFPDTLFRIHGYTTIAGLPFGIAAAVFQSLENEERFFVQHVSDGRIASFEQVSFSFDEFSAEKVPVRVGDEAIAFFITRAEGAICGPVEYVRAELTRLLQHSLLFGEEQLEAARLIGDDALVDHLLEEIFFRIRDTDEVSSEFFLLNNILRDRVLDELTSTRMAEILKNCRLTISKGEVGITFPDYATPDECNVLKSALDRRVSRSKAFAQTLSARDEQDDADSMNFVKAVQEVIFDLPMGKEFLGRIASNPAFLPVSCVTFFRNTAAQQTNLFKTALEILIKLQRNESAREFLEGEGKSWGYPLIHAREIAAAMSIAAKKLEYDNPEFMLRIRVCTFRIRDLNVLRVSGWSVPESNLKLLCIDAASLVFLAQKYVVGVSFVDSIEVAESGEISPDNFSDELSFGAADKYTLAAVRSKLGL